MKFSTIFTSVLAIGTALAAPLAAPVESGTTSVHDLAERAKTYKYKLPKQPSKGQTGVWTDSNKLTHIYYGDDVKVHGSHVEYHNGIYPQHANKPFKLAGGTSRKGEIADNRRAALSKVSTQGKGFIRDEKPLASLSHGAKRTTVMKVPERESLIEGHLARIAKTSARKNGGSVVLHDNRSKTGTGPLGKVLKKRELEEMMMLARRGLGDTLSSGVDSLKNATESGADSLGDALTGKLADWEKKLTDLMADALAELKEAGDDVATAVGQLSFGLGGSSTGHQMGSFFQGMHNFDAVEEGMQANGTALSDDDLAQDQAAIDVYMGGFLNASKSIGESVMNDFYKFTDLALGVDSEDDGDDFTPAQDIFSVGDWKPFVPDNCTETTTGSNSTTGYNNNSTTIATPPPASRPLNSTTPAAAAAATTTQPAAALTSLPPTNVTAPTALQSAAPSQTPAVDDCEEGKQNGTDSSVNSKRTAEVKVW